MADTNKQTLTVAIIALLVSLGVPVANQTFGNVLSNELKDYYRCSIDGTIMELKGGVSTTQYSGYPYVGSTKGVIYCGTSLNKGAWIKLSVYAQSVGIDPYELLQPILPVPPKPVNVVSIAGWGKQWTCNTIECVEK